MILRDIRRADTLGLLWLGVVFAISLQACSTDHGLGPTVQGLRGTVHFNGAWPEDILEIRVVVSKSYPPESFLDLSGYSDAIPLLSDSVSYEIELSPGTYALVAVACRRSPNWNTECLLGFYHRQDDPGTPRSVEVNSGVFTGSVDIGVDFGDPPAGFSRGHYRGKG